ncbi:MULTISPECIES: hypothetical protein [Pseudomonas]|nr:MULTISPECIES: hypothetical protein [Pseudomonas]MBJ2220577.1 hypothetical protein [Pseudomonas sp. MF7453]
MTIKITLHPGTVTEIKEYFFQQFSSYHVRIKPDDETAEVLIIVDHNPYLKVGDKVTFARNDGKLGGLAL